MGKNVKTLDILRWLQLLKRQILSVLLVVRFATRRPGVRSTSAPPITSPQINNLAALGELGQFFASDQYAWPEITAQKVKEPEAMATNVKSDRDFELATIWSM